MFCCCAGGADHSQVQCGSVAAVLLQRCTASVLQACIPLALQLLNACSLPAMQQCLCNALPLAMPTLGCIPATFDAGPNVSASDAAHERHCLPTTLQMQERFAVVARVWLGR